MSLKSSSRLSRVAIRETTQFEKVSGYPFSKLSEVISPPVTLAGRRFATTETSLQFDV